MKSLPVLIIIPHGGSSVPEELSGHQTLTPFQIFIESDAGANFIYDLKEYGCDVIKSNISRLFIDTDSDYRSLFPLTPEGVIKKVTAMNKAVFQEDCYPDEIAISNILRRYYFPFHKKIRESIESRKPELIVQCHTHLPVGPENSADKGMPRPLVITGYTAQGKGSLNMTASIDMASDLAYMMGKALAKEGDTIAEKHRVMDFSDQGHIMKSYGSGSVPMLYLSISGSLLLTDRFFSLENMEISETRLMQLRKIIADTLGRFCRKYF